MKDQASDERAPENLSSDLWRESIFRSAPVGIAVAALDGRFVTANAAFQRMVGYTEAELRELTPLDLTDEGDRPAALERLNRLRTGVVQDYQVEKRYRRKDASRIWVRVSISLIPAGTRSPTCTLKIAEDITSRKDAEGELRKQNEILQKIFDHIPLMINFTSEDGRIELVNREWERTLGWSLEEIERLGVDIFAECYPEEQSRREVRDFIRAATGQWADFKPRVRDGRTLDTTWASVRLSDGTTIGIGVEITERKRTEEALRESEQRLRQLAEHIQQVLWILDPKAQRLLYVSPAYEQIWGSTMESLYRDRRSFLDAIHPDDRQRLLDAIEQQARIPLPVEITFRVIRPDGATRWIRDYSYPVRNEAGEVYRFVGLAEDITGRKQVEENLRRSEAYLAESERLGHIGSWGLKMPARQIVFWSREAYRIFGFDPRMGHPTLEAVLARIHPEESAVLETINRMLTEGKDFELDCRILLHDGSVRYIHSLGHPVVNHAGELVEFHGISMDVTDRRVAEYALQRSGEQLRALAAKVESVREDERTRLAREIHDELGQLLTGLKMDLKATLRHPPLHGRKRVRESQASLRLIDEAIQSVRKISAELRPGILDDLGLVAAVEWAAGEFAARTGTRCTLELPPEDLTIEPPIATALYRIFQETLTNIARHSEAKQFSVRVVRDGDGVSLEVRDNGKGFTEAELSPGGSLGLLGMKERAVLLGGRLNIRGSPGEGVTVTAWMPARQMGDTAQ